MVITTTVRATPGHNLDQDSCNTMLGQLLPINVPGMRRAQGIIRATAVAADGLSVTLAVEWPIPAAERPTLHIF